MAIKQFNSRITMKRDTASNWEQNNPVLLNGEIIIVDTASGEVRFKIGDGTKLYKQLPFSDEAVRALISAKQDEISLTENKAVISDASGKLSVSEVTSTELSYLDGVSSNLQTQINNKVPTTRKINSKPLSSDITLTASDVNAAARSTIVNSPLYADNWQGDSAPYTYTLAVTGVTANSNQEVLPALNITVEQLEALQSANIQDGGQASNTVTLKAYGDKPTIDLPIRVIKRGD